MEYDPQSHSLKCPKCLHGMETVKFDGVTIDRCTGCQGLWFDGNEAEQLKNISGSEIVDTGSWRKGHYYNELSDIYCPHCGEQMEKSSDWKQTHIWYEVCRNHGIFMDAGEFSDFKHESVLDRLRDFFTGKRPK